MKPIIAIAIVTLTSPLSAFAQTTRPAISLITDIEDGKKMVHASVTVSGKPVENVALQYFVQRTFGRLLIGQDTTLDDGSSAVAFPADLPGASDGNLHVMVRIKAPAKYSSVSAEAVFPAELQAAPIADAFPRALWAPSAPMALLVSIFTVLAAVWISYLFVVNRILAIRRGGRA